MTKDCNKTSPSKFSVAPCERAENSNIGNLPLFILVRKNNVAMFTIDVIFIWSDCMLPRSNEKIGKITQYYTIKTRNRLF